MSSVSPPLPQTANEVTSASRTERRLRAEWQVLQQLAERNPQRLTDLAAEDYAFRLTLRQTPALLYGGEPGPLQANHAVRILFPQFFPAAPLELYLDAPIYHPNVHPVTGFVCLWDRHRVSNNVEHALHKLVAILGWRLYNTDAAHIMQPEALQHLQIAGEALAAKLKSPGLLGLDPAPVWFSAENDASPGSPRRRRLS